MARNFRELRSGMSPRAREHSAEIARELRTQMRLQELRNARKLSQEQLAKQLHVNQSAVSKIEQRTDMYISTLRDYVRGMGGELQIVASFPGEDIQITQFEDLDDVNPAGEDT